MEFNDDLIISLESRDEDFVHFLFLINPGFMRYQYPQGKRYSVYTNLGMRYRHFQRFKLLRELLCRASLILDVGCGYGDVSLELASTGKQVVLIDINVNCLKVAQLRFRKWKLNMNADFILCDGTRLPFKNRSFDAALSIQVVEHVSDPVKLVVEKLRVSKQRIIVLCRNAQSLPLFPWIYYKCLRRMRPEILPKLTGYNEIYYSNYVIPPWHSWVGIKLTEAIQRVIANLFVFKPVFATNVAMVWQRETRGIDFMP